MDNGDNLKEAANTTLMFLTLARSCKYDETIILTIVWSSLMNFIHEQLFLFSQGRRNLENNY